MPVRVERADLENVARNLGKHGRPLPSSMAADTKLAELHRNASGAPAASPVSAPAAPSSAGAGTGSRTPAPGRRPASSAASGSTGGARAAAGTVSAPAGGRARPAAAGGYFSRAFSPSAAVRRAGGGRVGRAIGAGDAGGLLLVLVAYPIVLATLEHGSAGPGLWFRAKWLNETANGDSALPPPHNPGKLGPHVTAPDGRTYPKSGSWQDQNPSMPGYVNPRYLKPGSPHHGHGYPPLKLGHGGTV